MYINEKTWQSQVSKTTKLQDMLGSAFGATASESWGCKLSRELTRWSQGSDIIKAKFLSDPNSRNCERFSAQL